MNVKQFVPDDFPSKAEMRHAIREGVREATEGLVQHYEFQGTRIPVLFDSSVPPGQIRIVPRQR